jgi:hypothetical protein
VGQTQKASPETAGGGPLTGGFEWPAVHPFCWSVTGRGVAEQTARQGPVSPVPGVLVDRSSRLSPVENVCNLPHRCLLCEGPAEIRPLGAPGSRSTTTAAALYWHWQVATATAGGRVPCARQKISPTYCMLVLFGPTKTRRKTGVQ